MATGHLRPRYGKKGKSWQVIVEGDRDPKTGKRERRYKTVKGTKKLAEATLRQMIAEMESGIISKVSAMKLGDWLDEWLENYLPDIAVTTRGGYKEKINLYIKPSLGNIPIKALKTGNIQAWIKELKDERGLAPKTIHNAYNNLNAALEKAVVLRMLPYNPCVGVTRPKLKKYQAEVYDTKEIQTALDIAKGTDMYIIMVLGLLVGLRRGEMGGLKWDKIDFATRTIHIDESRVHGEKAVITKDSKSAAGTRSIAVGKEVITALEEVRKEYLSDKAELGAAFHDLGYVVRKKNGDPYHPDSLTTKWRRFLEMHELKIIRLHDTRHSNATALMGAGVNAKVVQTRLGHADVGITLNTYTHVLPGMDKQAADTLDNLIFN